MFMLALGARLFRCARFRNGPGISKGYRGESKNEHLPCLSFHRDASTRMSNPGKGVADRSHRRASPSPHPAQAGCRHSGVNPVVSHTSSHLPPCRSDEDRPSPSAVIHGRERAAFRERVTIDSRFSRSSCIISHSLTFSRQVIFATAVPEMLNPCPRTTGAETSRCVSD